MKKSLLALSLLAASASTAYAQSSVTLFGILDVNARSVKNGDTRIKQLGNNGYSANQLGVRGIEDLGGGLKAAFWVESSLSPDTGTASTENGSTKFWQRRATVSLISNFGEIRLGRDLDASYFNIAFDAFGNLGLGSLLNLVSVLGSGATTLVRADNMVAYYLPLTMGGFYGTAAVAAGEGVPGLKYRAGRIGYSNGPINVAAAIGNTATATNNDYELVNAGGTYDFGFAKLFALYNRAEFGARKQVITGLGVHVPIGLFTVRASAVRADASGGGTNANDAKLYALGGVYLFSKRTAVYGTYAHLSNKGAAAFSVSGAAGVVPAALATGRVSSGYELGLRHTF